MRLTDMNPRLSIDNPTWKQKYITILFNAFIPILLWSFSDDEEQQMKEFIELVLLYRKIIQECE